MFRTRVYAAPILHPLVQRSKQLWTLVSRSWTLQTVETRVSDNQKVGTYTIKNPSSALNIGLGWNWISEQGLSGGIHFIALIGNELSFFFLLNLSSSTAAISTPSLKSAAALEPIVLQFLPLHQNAEARNLQTARPLNML